MLLFLPGDTVIFVYYLNIRKVAVIGAGYIAVELAGILNALGSKVSSLIRYDKVTI